MKKNVKIVGFSTGTIIIIILIFLNIKSDNRPSNTNNTISNKYIYVETPSESAKNSKEYLDDEYNKVYDSSEMDKLIQENQIHSDEYINEAKEIYKNNSNLQLKYVTSEDFEFVYSGYRVCGFSSDEAVKMALVRDETRDQ